MCSFKCLTCFIKTNFLEYKLVLIILMSKYAIRNDEPSRLRIVTINFDQKVVMLSDAFMLSIFSLI